MTMKQTVGQSDVALFKDDPWGKFVQVVQSGNRDAVTKFLAAEGWRFCHLTYVTHPSHQWTPQMPYLLLRAYVGDYVFSWPEFQTTLKEAKVKDSLRSALAGEIRGVFEYILTQYGKPEVIQFHQDLQAGTACRADWKDKGLLP